MRPVHRSVVRRGRTSVDSSRNHVEKGRASEIVDGAKEAKIGTEGAVAGGIELREDDPGLGLTGSSGVEALGKQIRVLYRRRRGAAPVIRPIGQIPKLDELHLAAVTGNDLLDEGGVIVDVGRRGVHGTDARRRSGPIR